MGFPGPVLVCLCAAWCRLCEGFGPSFDTTARALHQHWPTQRARWVDIEDEAELVGDLDVDTFPAFLLLRDGAVLFAGMLTPQPEVLLRVFGKALAAPGLPRAVVDPAFAALAQRLAAVPARDR